MSQAGNLSGKVYSMSGRSSNTFLSLLSSMCAPTSNQMVFLYFTVIALILPVYCTFQQNDETVYL